MQSLGYESSWVALEGLGFRVLGFGLWLPGRERERERERGLGLGLWSTVSACWETFDFLCGLIRQCLFLNIAGEPLKLLCRQE